MKIKKNIQFNFSFSYSPFYLNFPAALAFRNRSSIYDVIVAIHVKQMFAFDRKYGHSDLRLYQHLSPLMVFPGV